jgi:dihydroflavonol-4-reductase
MSKPILVTGATGFLGLHVCEQLRDAGQTVRAIGRSTGDAVKALGLEYIQGSILEDDALAKAVAELVCINPSLILGPGDTWGSSTNDVLQLLAGKIPAVPPGGLSLVDVRDVATAALNALDRGRSGERYLLGAANWTLRTFIEQVGEIGQVRVPRMGVPGWLTVASAHLTEPLLRAIGQKPALDVPSAQMSRLYWYCDSSKAKADIGFRPRAPQETLGDTIGDLRSRGLVT